MPLIAEIGDTFETYAEELIEWQIPDFFSLPEDIDNFYHSPVFGLPDSCLCLRIYPNGETEQSTSGYIGLYIVKLDSSLPKPVSITFGFKGSDGSQYRSTSENKFMSNGSEVGQSKFYLRAELLKRKSTLLPSNILTVTCSLKRVVRHATKYSLFNRLWNLSRHMKTILDEGKRADFNLQSKSLEWPVHKMILESRCEYFAGMFRHGWTENTAGEVKFADIDDDVVKSVLNFLYTGEFEKMSVQNVCKLYAAAHELDLKDLKVLCVEYMKENICLELVCDAIVIVKKYEEGVLKDRVIKYFIQNADTVIASDAWKQFKEENSVLVPGFLEDIVLEKMKLIANTFLAYK